MQKKAQGISINTIIIAAIGLAVLVVLFLIFTGRLGIFNKGIDETATCQNACTGLGKTSGASQDKSSCEVNQGTYVAGTYKDATEGCCCT